MRSRERYYQEGEKSSRYFFNLEKRNVSKKGIDELLVNNVSKCNSKEILEEIKSFYKDLYTCKDEVSDNDIETYLNNIVTPELSPEQQTSCENQLSVDECHEVLKNMSKNKTPGSDGFSSEFYLCFWDILGKFLVDSLNFGFSVGQLSVTQTQAIITLIPKPGKDSKLIKNWRPISLLNIDYKIGTKVIAKRMENVLPNIIGDHQTAFIKGRYIGENIRLVEDILDYTNQNHIPGMLLFADLEKAFDSVEWNFLMATLKKFNFGPNMLSWIKCFYSNIKSCVINKGFSSGWFDLTRGVRQGCPLSTAIFVCVIEILALKTAQCKDIRGIKFPSGREIKCSFFADDATFFLSDLKSVEKLLNEMNIFGKHSGLKMNIEKTEIMKIGSLKLCDEPVFGIKPTREPVKMLGVFVGYDVKKCYDYNVQPRLTELKDKLDIWKNRDLTLRGKTLLVKSLGISQMTYLMSVNCVSDDILSDIQKILYKFLWNGKPDKIKRSVLIAPKEKGGIDMVNIFNSDKSLKIMWLKRFLTTGDSPWKEIPNYFFNKMGGLELLLQSNISESLFPVNFPKFYKEVILCWQTLKECNHTDTIEDILQMPLRNNKLFSDDVNRLLGRVWVKTGMIKVKDIIDDNGLYLSYEKFCEKYDGCIDFVTYYSIVNSLPKQMKEIKHLSISEISEIKKKGESFYI